jgi:hypothetical protein
VITWVREHRLVTSVTLPWNLTPVYVLQDGFSAPPGAKPRNR